MTGFRSTYQAGGVSIPARLVYNDDGAAPLVPMFDWSAGDIRKEVVGPLFPPMTDPYVGFVRDFNKDQHDPFVNEAAALHGAWAGSKRGRTAVLVAPGPSSAGISERLRPYRGNVDVIACNRAGVMIPDAEFFSVLDVVRGNVEAWCTGIDPAKTTLLCPTTANFTFSIFWRTAPLNRAYYWLVECGEHADPKYRHLQVLAQSRNVLVSTIHACHVLGYSRVLLVGTDFCKAPGDGGYYGDGSWSISGRVALDSKPVGGMWTSVRDIAGNMVRVTSNLVYDSHVVTVACEIAEDAGMEVVNCSGRGLLDIRRKGSLESELARL